jgi:lysophospholipase L1-like esterase
MTLAFCCPRFQAALMFARLFLLFLAGAALAADPTPRPNPARFAKDIAAFAADRPEQGGIVFTGSSSIRLWTQLKQDFPDLPVLNRGFGGSVANDLSVHFETVIARHAPKLLVTYTGGNDLNAKLTPDEAFADYTAFLDTFHARFPQARVILTSVKIAKKRLAQIPLVHELNRKLQVWTEGKDWVRYLDCDSYLADAKGRPIGRFYRDDQLHLNDEGYAEWKKILEPVLREEWARVKDL